jgi:membrane protein
VSDPGRQGKAGFGQVTRRSFAEFSNDDMMTYAAAVSYQVFFSLFPFITFILALLGFLNLQPVFDFLLQQSKALMPQNAFGMVQSIT